MNQDIFLESTQMSHKCILCKKNRPDFALKYSKTAEYCKDCKLSDMINIRFPKCQICKIRKQSYGIPIHNINCQTKYARMITTLCDFKCFNIRLCKPCYDIASKQTNDTCFRIKLTNLIH